MNLYEAKTTLSRLVNEVCATRSPVTICKNGKPVVDLTVHQGSDPDDPLKQDPLLRGARFLGDPCAPVDPEDWPEDLR